MAAPKHLSVKQREDLLVTLKARFAKHMNRHKSLEWRKVQKRLDASPEKLWSLHEMERTGGEPDVLGHDKTTGEYVFYDWTPPEIRKLGGAIFCDRRYSHVFTYHNGADSYYAARAFRGSLRV